MVTSDGCQRSHHSAVKKSGLWINVARSIVHLYGKKYFESILTPYVKIDWKWITDLNVKKELLEFKKANTKRRLTQKGRTIFLTLEEEKVFSNKTHIKKITNQNWEGNKTIFVHRWSSMSKIQNNNNKKNNRTNKKLEQDGRIQV